MYFFILSLSIIVLLFYYVGVDLLPSQAITSLFKPVYGHASPINYQPEPNQTFNSTQNAPDEVLITFTETPEPRASSIKVINSNNERIDNNDLSITEATKALSISVNKSKITDGVYTVNWLVLSKDDGHITKGSYVFSVDNLEVQDQSQQQQQQQQQQLSNKSMGYSKNLSISSENVDLHFDINPFEVGQNTFSLSTAYSNGTKVENIKDVYLEFNNPSKNLGPIIETMNKTDTGEHSLAGSFLSQNGDWEIKMTMQRIGEYDINHQFDVRLD